MRFLATARNRGGLAGEGLTADVVGKGRGCSLLDEGAETGWWESGLLGSLETMKRR